MKQTLTVAMAAIAFGASTMAHAAFYVAGDFQTPSAWQNNTDIMNDLGNDHYQLSFTGVSAGTHEMKITDGTWTTTYPASNKRVVVGSNGNLTIDFFNKTTFGDGWVEDGPRIGFTTSEAMSWDIIGAPSFLTGWGSGIQLTNIGGNVFKGTFTPTSTGAVELKFRKSGVWGEYEFGQSGGSSTNITYDFQSLNQTNVYFDPANGRYKFEVVPEPATMTVLGGLAALAALKRRKK